jgi:WD40 repeat protein
MFKRLALIILLFFIPTLMAYAQGAPDQINLAVADLGSRLGTTLTLDTLENWNWAQDSYPDGGLGCPQEGVTYRQEVTVGYRFELTYGGILYDYRVSADGSTVIQCSATNLAEATPEPTTTPDPTIIDTAIPCAEPEQGVIYLPTRMTVGMQAQVTAGLPNNLREEPTTESDLLAEMPGAAVFRITGGPICEEQLVWWQVNFNGTVGWTVEGRDGQYWIEPIPGAVLPQGIQPIAVSNAETLTEVSRSEGNYLPEIAWSPANSSGESYLVTLGGRGTEGIWVFQPLQRDIQPRLIREDRQLLSLDFKADASILLLGGLDGSVRLWNISPNAPLVEVTNLQGHQDTTSAVAFDPTGTLFASVGSLAYTVDTEAVNTNAIVVWNAESVAQTLILRGHGTRVNSLDFSPDGTLLASASGATAAEAPDNTVRVWDVTTGEEKYSFDGHDAPVRDVEFSPDGSLIASASLDGSVRLWDVATGEELRKLETENGNAFITLAFSPDGTLLAAGGGDETQSRPDYSIYLWEVETGAAAAVLPGHGQTVGGLAFSPDGTVLASIGDDLTMRLWATTASAESVG